MSYRKYIMPSDISPSELFKAVEVGTDLAEVGTDCISRQAALDALNNIEIPRNASWYQYYQQALTAVDKLPPAQPEQLEQCPIYGGMCAYPSDQCYDCPRHAGAKMEVTE